MYIQSINIFNKYIYTQVINFLKQLSCLTNVRAVVSVNDTCYQKVKLKSILPKKCFITPTYRPGENMSLI